MFSISDYKLKLTLNPINFKMVIMKATMHTHHHSKLIADVFVPQEESATNRRGHAMSETPTTTHQSPEHECHEHAPAPTRPRAYKKLTLARHSVLPAMLYKLKRAFPAWAPRKFTYDHGVETNWEAVLPSKQALTNAGLLASFLVIGAFAVWMMPQKNSPQVIAEKPAHVAESGNTKQAPVTPQVTLTAASSPAAPAQTTGWRLVLGRASTASSVLPALAAASQPNNVAATTPSSGQSSPTQPSQSGTTPTDTTTTPTTGGTTPTDPTEPTTPPVDPPVDPPTEPVDPPIIIDPPLDGLNELLGIL